MATRISRIPITAKPADNATTDRSTVLAQGVLAGFIGYAALAAIMAVVDLAHGRSAFHTAAILGASLFYGVTDPAQVPVIPAYVLAYNGAHLLVFLALGVIGAALATLADRGAQLWYLSTFFFLFVAFHAIGAAQAMSEELRASISEVTVWAGGIVAALLMGAYLVWMHPLMRKTQRWDG